MPIHLGSMHIQIQVIHVLEVKEKLEGEELKDAGTCNRYQQQQVWLCSEMNYTFRASKERFEWRKPKRKKKGTKRESSAKSQSGNMKSM